MLCWNGQKNGARFDRTHILLIKRRTNLGKVISRLGEKRLNTYGTEMEIIEYKNWNEVTVRFLDEHGVKVKTTYGNYSRGQVHNPYDKTAYGVGYIGEGKYKTGRKSGTRMEYIWRCMLQRCYHEKEKHLHPAYYGICTVCDEWLNYQNFCKWYEENYYEAGKGRMHLDKDILVKGNTVYSPETCLIIPQRINLIFMDKGNGRNTGIRHNNKRYEALYGGSHLGTFDTFEEATKEYDKAKREHIKNVVKEFDGQLPQKVVNALLAW